MKRRKPARSRDEQHRERERRDEHAFFFASDGKCFGKVERNEWNFAIYIAGGNVVEAARRVGLEVPGATRALWGRSQEAAIGAYRNWLKRKARKE